MKLLKEDLRKWFGSGKKGGWDRYNTKGEKIGKCGDGETGDAYAACLSNEKSAKLGPKGRASFVNRKRAAQKKAGDAKKGGEQSKGQKPTLVKTKANEMKLEQKLELFLEKNVPTDPQKWSYATSQAKKKFDVYPSAYANGWAAKKYKELGGGWKTDEGVKLQMEQLNPELDRVVRKFVNNIEFKYGYDKSDAMHAIFQSLHRLKLLNPTIQYKP